MLDIYILMNTLHQIDCGSEWINCKVGAQDQNQNEARCSYLSGCARTGAAEIAFGIDVGPSRTAVMGAPGKAPISILTAALHRVASSEATDAIAPCFMLLWPDYSTLLNNIQTSVLKDTAQCVDLIRLWRHSVKMRVFTNPEDIEPSQGESRSSMGYAWDQRPRTIFRHLIKTKLSQRHGINHTIDWKILSRYRHHTRKASEMLRTLRGHTGVVVSY
ncbi:hypothetical protein RB195_017638 [Necator americanus]|uniref:Uncharacterized protein n=1 Tax=Necator americanus TaxID=51031 RepID=A0ABR1C642_NECAM